MRHRECLADSAGVPLPEDAVDSGCVLEVEDSDGEGVGLRAQALLLRCSVGAVAGEVGQSPGDRRIDQEVDELFHTRSVTAPAGGRGAVADRQRRGI